MLGRQRAPQYEDGEGQTPYLRSANITDGRIDVADVKSMRFSPSERATFALCRGDVLVTEGSGSRATVGASAVWQDNLSGSVCFQNTLLRLRPRPGTDGRYLAWWARHAHASGLMAAAATGANILHIGAEHLRQLPIALPDLGQQRRIADFLDDQVARLDAVAHSAEELMHRLGMSTDARVQGLLLGSDLPAARQATYQPFGHVPEGWVECRLRSIPCQVQTGPFGSQLHAEDYVDDQWPVINPANIRGDRLVADWSVTVDDSTRGRLKRHVLKADDVMFARRGGLGRAALVRDKEAGWLSGTGSLVVRLSGRVLRPNYLVHVLQTAAVRHYFAVQAVGSTMANLNTAFCSAYLFWCRRRTFRRNGRARWRKYERERSKRARKSGNLCASSKTASVP